MNNQYENIKIGILGGDLRQIALARRLAAAGFETAVWGLGASPELGSAVQCVDYISVINKSRALILPLPASGDGVRVNFPLLKCVPDIRLNEIIDLLGRGALLLGGMFTPSFKTLAAERGVRLCDYNDLEEFKIKNALPTAEGALEIALRELPVTIRGSAAAVVGFGRIGSILSGILAALGARVTVAARSKADLARAEISGCKTIKIGGKGGGLSGLAGGYDVIFNTVPVCLFDEKLLAKMPRSTLLVELASTPGGFDTAYAKEAGLQLIIAMSLPGKTAPYTAGGIICDCVTGILEQAGVV